MMDEMTNEEKAILMVTAAAMIMALSMLLALFLVSTR